MKAVAIAAFLAGLLLAVRVMLFGVQRRLNDDQLAHRKWPLALAAFLTGVGALLYARTTVTAGWVTLVVMVGVLAGAGAWWLVQHSAAIPSSDPEDDPRYRFQGHVARVVESIETPRQGDSRGRIAFSFDGRSYELRARWTPGDWEEQGFGRAESEVVIERVEDDVAYVEPWAVVEERL
jgi:hypothetical protein